MWAGISTFPSLWNLATRSPDVAGRRTGRHESMGRPSRAGPFRSTRKAGSVPARRHRDGPLLEALALRVGVGDRLESVGRDRRVIGVDRWIALDDRGTLRDLDRLAPEHGVEDADAEGRRPDESVDLVEHPGLMSGPELTSRVGRVLDAIVGVVPAVDPALERGADEADRDVAVAFLVQPRL